MRSHSAGEKQVGDGQKSCEKRKKRNQNESKSSTIKDLGTAEEPFFWVQSVFNHFESYQWIVSVLQIQLNCKNTKNKKKCFRESDELQKMSLSSYSIIFLPTVFIISYS